MKQLEFDFMNDGLSKEDDELSKEELTLEEWKEYIDLEVPFMDYNDESYGVFPISEIPEGCRGCSNHPSNGGSGICHCTIGSNITY